MEDIGYRPNYIRYKPNYIRYRSNYIRYKPNSYADFNDLGYW